MRQSCWRLLVGNLESSSPHNLFLPQSVENRTVLLCLSEMTSRSDERSPLLQNGHSESQQDEPEVRFLARSSPKSTSKPAQIIDFSKEDDEDPRNWPRRRKFVNVAIIAFMASK